MIAAPSTNLLRFFLCRFFFSNVCVFEREKIILPRRCSSESSGGGTREREWNAIKMSCAEAPHKTVPISLEEKKRGDKDYVQYHKTHASPPFSIPLLFVHTHTHIRVVIVFKRA